MIDLKKVYITTFKELISDKELLDLLEIEYENVSDNTFMKNVRKQITEESSPEDMLNDYDIRLCIHDQKGGYQKGRLDVAYLAIDIYITKEQNKKDRRALLILRKIIELLDTNQRKERGIPCLNIGFDGLSYNTRLLDEKSDTTGWEKYSVVFKYSYFI